MSQSKDTDELGYMIHIYVCKKHTSEQNIYTGWKWRDGKNIPCKWTWKKKTNPCGSDTYIIRQSRLQNKGHIRDKEGHYIILKGVVQQEDITIVNIYVPNIEAPKYI